MDGVRHAFRRLLKHPGPSFASVLTLASAIAAVAATYSLISALLLRPVPVHDPDRLVVVGTRIQDTEQLADHHVYTLFTQVRDSGVFERVVALGTSRHAAVVDVNGSRIPVAVHHPTFDFFTALGIRISPGRTFLPEDDRRGAPLAMIVSERFWRRSLRSDAGVIGHVVRINDRPATIVGVAPAGFRGIDLSEPADVYLPLHTAGDLASFPRNYFDDPEMRNRYSPQAWIVVIGRMRAGFTAAQTRSALSSLPARAGSRAAPHFGLISIQVASLPTRIRPRIVDFTTLLAATAGLLLLIGSVTVGMLLLVRTEARRDEFAVCLALGASPRLLATGVAVEGALLSISGVLVAIPLTSWLLKAVRAFQLPGGINLDRLAVDIDARAFGSAAACALAATAVITALAGISGFRADVADALRARAGVTPRTSRRRTRALLVATQVAVALVLVAGSALFVRSTAAALQLNPGFDPSRVLSGSLTLPRSYDPARAEAFFDTLQRRLDAVPAIEVVSMSAIGDGMSAGGRLTIDGEPREMPSPVPLPAVDEHYFQAMGMHVVEGRDFDQTDTQSAPPVGIVSESFRRFIAPGSSSLGHHVRMPFWRPPAPPAEVQIIGVVPDVITNVADLQPFVLYRPVTQAPPGAHRTAVVRLATGMAVDAARREIAAVVHQIDSSLDPPVLTTINEQLMRQMAPQRFGALVMGALGTIALLLTMLGTYVLSESMAVMRVRELGIRAALGATRPQLGALVLAETARLVGTGIAAGLLLAWMGANTIRSFLFRIAPLDASTLALVAGLIVLVSLVVSVRPALRAARVDLSTVLKHE